MDTIPVDVEHLLRKVCRYFHIYTVKYFCNFVGEAYQTILSHSTVWWLSMLSAVERNSQMYAPLKSYIFYLEKCPAVLGKLFDDPLTKLWVTFAHANLTLFGGTIRQLESQDCCVVETGEKLKSLGIVLRGRLADDFISESVSVLLFNFLEEGLTTRDVEAEAGSWMRKRWKRYFFCGSGGGRGSAKNPPLPLPHKREEWREKRNLFCYPS